MGGPSGGKRTQYARLKRWRSNPKNRVKMRKANKLRHRADPRNKMISAAKRRAKLLNLPFDITKNDLILPKKCSILGILLQVNSDRWEDNSPSIDRIIPELGYVRGNIQIISFWANRIKKNRVFNSVADMLSYIRIRARRIPPSVG